MLKAMILECKTIQELNALEKRIGGGFTYLFRVLNNKPPKGDAAMAEMILTEILSLT